MLVGYVSTRYLRKEGGKEGEKEGKKRGIKIPKVKEKNQQSRYYIGKCNDQNNGTSCLR